MNSFNLNKHVLKIHSYILQISVEYLCILGTVLNTKDTIAKKSYDKFASTLMEITMPVIEVNHKQTEEQSK